MRNHKINRTICVFAAHPDDEILGCGATMAKHHAEGDLVHVIIMAEGLTSRSNIRDVSLQQEDLISLKEVACKANELIGSATVDFLEFPDNRMDSVDLLDIVKKVEVMLQKYQPSVVYTHHASDVNIDHQRTHEAVITACRPQPNYFVKRLLCFEVASSTEWQPASSKLPFNPNWFNQVSAESMQKKLGALELYDSEMRQWPHARSIEAVAALSKWRGATVGVDCAEAFVLARNLES